MKRISLFLFCTLGMLCTVHAQSFDTKKMDSLFESLLVHNKTMGSFAIVKNGVFIYKRSLGFSQIKDGKKIEANSETQYHIGSATKMFTAVMIFQLMEEGKLSLDTRLHQFFPLIANSNDITIEMLLNHTSGIYDFVNDQKDISWITKPHSVQEIVDVIQKGKSHFLPGTKFTYSNSGYFLLARIVQHLTATSYAKNLQDRICNRIQLTRTLSPVNEAEESKYAASFQLQKNEWKPITDLWYTNVTGVGDIVSTPTELIIFIEALLSGKLIADSSLKHMETFKDKTFGMGLMKIPFYDKSSFGHGGDTYGTHTIVSSFPQDSLSIAYSINGEATPHNDISIWILKICFDVDFEIPTFSNIKLTPAELSRYCGKYNNTELPMEINIFSKKGSLFAQASGQNAFPITNIGIDKFYFEGANILIEFIPGKNEFRFKQNRNIYMFKEMN